MFTAGSVSQARTQLVGALGALIPSSILVLPPKVAVKRMFTAGSGEPNTPSEIKKLLQQPGSAPVFITGLELIHGDGATNASHDTRTRTWRMASFGSLERKL